MAILNLITYLLTYDHKQVPVVRYLIALSRFGNEYLRFGPIWTDLRGSVILIGPVMSLQTHAVSEEVSGLFVPLHFRSWERKVHRENFRSRGTFVPWNIRSRGANVPRTFVPWNFRTRGTFAPQTTFVPFNFHSCGTFAAVLKKVVEFSRKAVFP